MRERYLILAWIFCIASVIIAQSGQLIPWLFVVCCSIYCVIKHYVLYKVGTG